MKTLKYNAKGPEVIVLCDMLSKIGYSVKVTESFTAEVDAAVKDFQMENNLVIDGIVGIKTWSKLIEKSNSLTDHNDKLLSENDLIEFASVYDVELAAVKAVNEVESSGKGFLIDGRPRILFEGHVFWRELEKRNIDPNQYLNPGTQDILYPSWTKKYYLGGSSEYGRLQKAIGLKADKNVQDAANASASWGAFQIMGFNALALGYSNIDEFVTKMQRNEREHLMAFGLFLKKNDILKFLKNKNWAEFALRYNGKGYKANKYDVKLEKAYQKYS
ncbi:N-acetylmuramidase domain-containing protein [Flavobacterium pedocola]